MVNGAREAEEEAEEGVQVTSLWFVVPASGRVALTEVCLRQLARTCETLTENGIQASAVVISDDENLETAEALGFATVDPTYDRAYPVMLGRRFNDGYELAGLADVDFCVPLGSDDWIDPAVILEGELRDDRIRCFRLGALVREDGEALAPIRIGYQGGLGIRVIPTEMLAWSMFRPAEDDGRRAIDGSVWRGICDSLGYPPELEYVDLHSYQVVDWKSDVQLNSYADCLKHQDGPESTDPFGDLAAIYPAEALDEMRSVYGLVAA